MSSNTGPQAANLSAPKPNPSAGLSNIAANSKRNDASKVSALKKKVRRKKPPSTKGPTNVAIEAAARMASGELHSLKAAEASKKKDPLWYRSSEVLQAMSGDNMTLSNSSVPVLLAEQVDLVEYALSSNHMTRADVTPQAFAVLLEQARRFALELVADAQDCAYAAHRHDITRADLILALELRPDTLSHRTHTLADLQSMKMVAHNLNRIPLPPIPQHCYSGIVLPPKPHQLTARTYDIVTGAHTAQKMSQSFPLSGATTSVPNPESSTGWNRASTPGYGASRGRMIPIKLQSKPHTVSTSGATANQSSANATALSSKSIPLTQSTSSRPLPG
jgi:Transcription initiation factor IID, 31kD subunit